MNVYGYYLLGGIKLASSKILRRPPLNRVSAGTPVPRPTGLRRPVSSCFGTKGAETKKLAFLFTCTLRWSTSPLPQSARLFMTLTAIEGQKGSRVGWILVVLTVHLEEMRARERMRFASCCLPGSSLKKAKCVRDAQFQGRAYFQEEGEAHCVQHCASLGLLETTRALDRHIHTSAETYARTRATCNSR